MSGGGCTYVLTATTPSAPNCDAYGANRTLRRSLLCGSCCSGLSRVSPGGLRSSPEEPAARDGPSPPPGCLRTTASRCPRSLSAVSSALSDCLPAMTLYQRTDALQLPRIRPLTSECGRLLPLLEARPYLIHSGTVYFVYHPCHPRW